MSDIYAATDGTAGGNGSQSMPYDLATALTAQTAADRLIVMPGVYAQSATVGSGLLIEGHFTGRPIIYGGAQITGTWEHYSGDVYRIATANPVASSLGKLILRTHSGLFLAGEYMDSLAEVTEDREWYHDGTWLYLHSSDGDPSVAYWRVDKASLTGTASSIYGAATGGLYLGAGKDGVTLTNLGVYGFRGNGLLVDDCASITVEDCATSYNAEDGRGGFAMPDYVSRRNKADWNGTRRVRLGELGLTDGDGESLHDGSGIPSTNFSIRDNTYEGNCKAGPDNIEGSSGTIERCTITNCGFGLILNTYATQTFRNITLRAGDLGVGAFGIVVGTANVHNCTFIGRDQAASTAVISIFGVGSVTMRNSIITGWPTAFALSTTTFTHSHNCFDATTLGVTLGTGEIQTDPLIVAPRYGLAPTSPCLGTGTSLAATFVDDRYGRRRSTTWSMGAVELVDITPRGRVLEALCDALEDIGDESQPWQTMQPLTKVVRYGRSAEGATAPFIAITSVAETYERVSTSGVYQRTMKVDLVYVWSDWESFDWLGAVAADVELAVGEDRTLGGVCDDATFTGNVSRVDSTDASVAFTIELRYRTQDTAPLSRV
jgi:hypothetical protein